jgi:hypothetical protein
MFHKTVDGTMILVRKIKDVPLHAVIRQPLVTNEAPKVIFDNPSLERCEGAAEMAVRQLSKSPS